MYEINEAKLYKKNFVKYIKKEVITQKFQAETNKFQHFYCDTVFYFPRVDMDCNNYWKLLLDAVTESQCVWLDDNVACERVKGIYYDRSNPRIEMTIHPVDYIGVFENKKTLVDFQEKCLCCSRYRDGRCSVLNDGTQGIITHDINLENYECSKFTLKKITKSKK